MYVFLGPLGNADDEDDTHCNRTKQKKRMEDIFFRWVWLVKELEKGMMRDGRRVGCDLMVK